MLQKILIAFGGVLITTSLIIFLMFVQLAYQVFYEPEQVGIVQFIIKQIPQSQEAISGTINGDSFAIHIAEPFRLLACFIVVTLCSSVLVSIFRIIMMAGIALIKLGTTQTIEQFDNHFGS